MEKWNESLISLIFNFFKGGAYLASTANATVIGVDDSYHQVLRKQEDISYTVKDI